MNGVLHNDNGISNGIVADARYPGNNPALITDLNKMEREEDAMYKREIYQRKMAYLYFCKHKPIDQII